MTRPAIAVRGLCRDFGGVRALHDVSLDVPVGERHALIGPNGAGKSTLLRAMAGADVPTAGTIAVRGTDVTGGPSHVVARLGVARTFQHSACFMEETLLDHCVIAAAARVRSRAWRSPRRDRRLLAVAWEALDAAGLSDRAHDVAGALSHGEARQLEIAVALAQRPQLLLADEPLAGLSPVERRHVGALLTALPAELTLVVVEHDVEFVLGLADRVTVLDHGEVVARGSPDEVRADPVVERVYLGATAAAQPRRSRAGTSADVALAARGVRAGYRQAEVLHGVDLTARTGEVLAVLGRNGMGKTTLLSALMGLVAVRAGSVELAGTSLTGWSVTRRARAGLTLVGQGRGILSGLSVAEQLTVRAQPGRWTLDRVYELFPLLADRRTQQGTTLSGGEQQMLALARALLLNPRVLLLDEPSDGLAPAVVAQIAELLADIAEAGETIVLAEQNVRMALGVADTALVLERGAVAWSGPADALRDDTGRQRALLGV